MMKQETGRYWNLCPRNVFEKEKHIVQEKKWLEEREMLIYKQPNI